MSNRFKPYLVAFVLAAGALGGARAEGLDLQRHPGQPIAQDLGLEGRLVPSGGSDGANCAGCGPVPQGLHAELTATRALRLGPVHFHLNEALDGKPSGDQAIFGLELWF